MDECKGVVDPSGTARRRSGGVKPRYSSCKPDFSFVAPTLSTATSSAEPVFSLPGEGEKSRPVQTEAGTCFRASQLGAEVFPVINHAAQSIAGAFGPAIEFGDAAEDSDSIAPLPVASPLDILLHQRKTRFTHPVDQIVQHRFIGLRRLVCKEHFVEAFECRFRLAKFHQRPCGHHADFVGVIGKSAVLRTFTAGRSGFGFQQMQTNHRPPAHAFIGVRHLRR